ncbi:MAG: transglutaminase family protein [Pseudomonadota bacterium]
MRLTIQHETRYSYSVPPTSVIEVLRLTPCNSDTQSVRDWAITVSGDAPLRRFEDAFGNVCHTFTGAVEGDELSIVASGTVDTSGTAGVMAGTRERLPLGIFLRETPLTEQTPAIRALADEARRDGGDSALAFAHSLNRLINERIAFVEGATDVATPAEDALAAGRGVCQDLTHVILAAARAQAIPARYVSGYQFEAGRARDKHAGHAWAELYIDDLGWVGFDPTAGTSSDDSYVRVATGLDYMSASPVRGAIYGGGGEALFVAVTMDGFQYRGTSVSMDQSGSQ